MNFDRFCSIYFVFCINYLNTTIVKKIIIVDPNLFFGCWFFKCILPPITSKGDQTPSDIVKFAFSTGVLLKNRTEILSKVIVCLNYYANSVIGDPILLFYINIVNPNQYYLFLLLYSIFVCV